MDKTENVSTVSERAYQMLRLDVLKGTYLPGSKLKLEELQSGYGFSSSPIREALNRLTQEGLVRSDERRGFRVTAMSPEDLADIIAMRLMLDIPALRESIRCGDDAWEASILACFHHLEKVESRLPVGPVNLNLEWSQRHRDFHIALLAACPSERQRKWSESLFDQAERYRHFSARHRKPDKQKSNQHRALIKAALNRDSKTACTLLTEHIQSTEKNVLAAFKLAKTN
jgi:GntR family transcriptional regulator, carbon starvation induced regulator